jgi:hypothetical protein
MKEELMGSFLSDLMVPEYFFEEAAADNDPTAAKIAMEAKEVVEIASMMIPAISISLASENTARFRHLLIPLKAEAQSAISFSVFLCDLREDAIPTSSRLRNAD